MTRAVWMLALGNAVPFVGHLSVDAGIRKSLYCPGNVCGERSPIPPLGVQVLVIVQNVVSIALIFFFGLALRIISRSSDWHLMEALNNPREQDRHATPKPSPAAW